MILWGFEIIVRRAVVPAIRVVSEWSVCPGCGHAGCKLKAVVVENKGPMIERCCNTCGALCYEATVVEPEKWVAK